MKPSLLRKTWTHLALMLLAGLVLLPFLYVLLISFGQGVVGIGAAVPEAFTADNYRRLFSETLYLQWLSNSLVISLVTALAALVLVSVSVYVFSRLRFAGKEHLFQGLLLIQVFPLTLSMVSLFKLFVALGLINRMESLMLVNTVLSSAGLILMAKGYFDTIPIELDEAAAMDGAGRLTILRRILLPLAKPMLTVVALQSFVLSYNEYVIASAVMNQGLGAIPLAVGLQSMIQGQFGTNWALYCAGAVVGSLPMLALFYALQKYFVGGLTDGSVKS